MNKTKTRSGVKSVLRRGAGSGLASYDSPLGGLIDYPTPFTETVSYDTGAKFNRCHHVVEKSLDLYLGGAGREARQHSIWASWPPQEGVDRAVKIGLAPRMWHVDQVRSEETDKDLTNHQVDLRISDAVQALYAHPIRGVDADLPLALCELHDTGRSFRALANLIRFVRLLATTGIGDSRVNLLEASVFTVAELYLTYTFGIAPTIKDVRAFLKTLPDILRLTVFRKVYGKGSVIRAGFTVLPDKVRATLAGGEIVRTAVITDRRGLSRTPGLLVADPVIPGPHRILTTRARGVVFAQVVQDFTYEQSMGRAILDGSDPLAIAWNLVSLSFVVDWFFNVDRLLRQAGATARAAEIGWIKPTDMWLSLARQEVVYDRIVSSSEDKCVSTGLSMDNAHFDYKATWRYAYKLQLLSSVYDRGPFTPFRVPFARMGTLVTPFRMGASLALMISACKPIWQMGISKQTSGDINASKLARQLRRYVSRRRRK